MKSLSNLLQHTGHRSHKHFVILNHHSRNYLIVCSVLRCHQVADFMSGSSLARL